MNLRNNKTFTRFVGVALCLGGLLAASVTMAGGRDHHGDGGLYDDDDGYGYHGNDREPRFRDKGDTLEAFVEVRGLRGNRNVRAELEATAELEIECDRYGGGYGRGYGYGRDRDRRRQIDLEVDGVEYYSRHRIHGSRLDVRIETDDIEDELRGYYGDDLCPGRARGKIESVQFSDAKLEIRQGGRELVTWLCSFDRDTRNGTVSRGNVDCVTLY